MCVCVCVCVCVCSFAQLCPSLCYSIDYSLPGVTCPRGRPGKNTGVGCHFILQGIFLPQGQSPCFLNVLYWHVDSSPLCHLASSPLTSIRASVETSGTWSLSTSHWLKFPQSEEPIGCTSDWKPGLGERRMEMGMD